MDPYGGKNKLVNLHSRKLLTERLNAESFKRKTISFYKYVIIDDPMFMRNFLFEAWQDYKCLGRIYIANEGINAQMSVPEYSYNAFLTHLYSITEFAIIPIKVAIEDDGKSFIKLVVKVRPQIVADGLSLSDYDVTNVGKHLSAHEWNTVIDKGATVVDMRNYYESEIGHFDGAKLPQAETFRDELPEVLNLLKGKEEEPILLYCTGGIRCEKTSAFLKHYGFKNVNQLHGGIIEYARQIEHYNLENKFKGKNFVFDKRLGERITNEVISTCHQCNTTCDTHNNCKNVHCNLLFLQCPNCGDKYQGCCSERCLTILNTPEEKKKEVMNSLGFTRSPRYYRKDSCLLK